MGLHARHPPRHVLHNPDNSLYNHGKAAPLSYRTRKKARSEAKGLQAEHAAAHEATKISVPPTAVRPANGTEREPVGVSTIDEQDHANDVAPSTVACLQQLADAVAVLATHLEQLERGR